MSELKKLFQAKRILALVLAVAMLATSVPVTANASEASGNGKPQTELATQEPSVSDEAEVETETEISDEAYAEEEAGGDEGDAASEGEGDTSASDGADTNTPSEGEGNTPDTSEPAAPSDGENNTPATGETEKAVYTFDMQELTKEYRTAEYNKDVTPFANEVEGETPDIIMSYDILSRIYLRKEGSDEVSYNLAYNGGDEIVKSITYTWKKVGADGNYTALAKGKAPKDAGEYQLTIALPAKENEYDMLQAAVDFEITKAPVTVDFDMDFVTPGTQVKDVIGKLSYFGASAADGRAFVYMQDDKDTADVDESKDNEMAVTLKIKDAYDVEGKVLASDYVLMQDEDYYLELSASFTDKVAKEEQGNYDIRPCDTRKLNIADLKESRVDLKLSGAWLAGEKTQAGVIVDNNKNSGGVSTVSKITAKVYDGSAVAELQEGVDYTVEIKDALPVPGSDGKETFNKIPGAALAENGEWHTATYETWKESVKNDKGENELADFCNLTVGGKLETAPVNAGVYVYRVIYEGSKGIYAESYADIVVEIEKVELIIRPEMQDGISFTSEHTAEDVLEKVAYKAYDAKKLAANPADQSAAISVTDRFWGTSYDNNNKTQPYEPLFEVVKITADKDGNVLEERSLEPYEKLALPSSQGEDADKETVTYKVRFSGYKTVYNANGSYSYDNIVDINNPEDSTNGSYEVLIDKDTLNAPANTVTVSVNKAANADIVTDKIVSAFMDKSTAANPHLRDTKDSAPDKNKRVVVVSKIYDEKRLFDSRTEYKQAEVISGTETIKSNTDSSLNYSWYRNTRYSDAAAMQAALADYSEGEYESYFNSSDWTRWYGLSPKDAGIYTLKITYTDADAAHYAKPAYVCFVIHKQKIEVEITDKNYTELSNITPEQFFEDTKIEYTIKTELTPDTTGEAEDTAPRWMEDEGHDWGVYRSKSDREYGYASTSAWGHDAWERDSYAVKWAIEKKVKVYADEPNADGEYELVDKKDENGAPVYEPVSMYEPLIYGESYRIAVAEDGFCVNNRNYTVSNIYLKEVKPEPDSSENAAPDQTGAADDANKVTYVRTVDFMSTKTAPLKVTQMGSVVIELNTSEVLEVEQEYDGTSISQNAKLKAGLDKIKPVRLPEGENADASNKVEITDITLETTWYDDTTGYEFPAQEADSYAVNGGVYEIYLSFRGNEKYAALEQTLVAVAKITPQSLTLTLQEPSQKVVAGSPVKTIISELSNIENLKIEDMSKVPEKDKDAFAYQYYCTLHYGLGDDSEYDYEGHAYTWGIPAWSYQAGFMVCDADDNAQLAYNSVVKGEKEYTLGIEYTGELRTPYDRNYVLKAGESAHFTTIRGASSITTVKSSNIKNIDSRDSISSEEGKNITHTLSIYDAVEYTDYVVNDKKVYGNFVALLIMPPAEYENVLPGSLLYENSIKKMEGYITHYTDETDFYNGSRIVVIVDAGKGDQSFDITWEPGYIEHFDMKFPADKMLGDLNKAVAPKSISFNAPNKKMVVGEEQVLDVKLTKELKDDVICLAYKVDYDNKDKDKNVLSVNEYGKVTALKKGSASVTVYPVYLKDGKKTAIEGAKRATVKITVTDVTAPKISKVIAGDTYAYVQYPYIKDVNNNYGYRREIYVLEGKNKKPQDFEDSINKMSNENWEGIFATAPIFVNNATEYGYRLRTYNKKTEKMEMTNTVNYPVSGLSRTKEYTVYVRNVSAIRTLSDKSQVAKSAAGNVKAFKTTNAQVKRLEAALQGKTPTDVYYDQYYTDYELLDEIRYTLPLSDGNAALSVDGIFENKIKDASSDTQWSYGNIIYDTYRSRLPLSAADKKDHYADPKLVYGVANYGSGYDIFTGEYVVDDEYYMAANDFVAVDKKGKITLKQPGIVKVCVMDSDTGIVSNPVYIEITAKADSIKGKNTSLQVGQAVPLESLLTYKSGKKTLNITSGFDREVEISETLKNSIEQGGYFKLFEDTGYIMAVKEGGKCTVTLKDKYVGSASASVTIKSTALSPVKNLQFMDVIDNRFTIRFERNKYAQGYRIEVKNGRNTTIRSVYVENNDLDDEWYYMDNGDGAYYFVTDYNDDMSQADWRCNARKNYCEYTVYGLTQQSKYNVTVTALFEGAASSKAASKAVSTTKLPAADSYLSDSEIESNYYGGIGIQVVSENNRSVQNVNFVSGNTYTLKAIPENWGAKYAATDSLTWNITDKKVAAIKANAGTYSAEFKPLKPGSTIIEIKSGVLKRVIARYKVTVRSVGDAYSSGKVYYGDNEDLRGEGTGNIDAYTELILGEPAPVDLAAGDYKWFAYTAEESGRYSFYRVENGDSYTDGFYITNNINNGSYNGTTTFTMQKGSTVYIKAVADGSYTMNVKKIKDPSETTALEFNKDIKTSVESGQMFVFTAPEEGFYRFSGVSFDMSKDKAMETVISGNPVWSRLKKNETVYLRSNYSSTNAVLKVTKENIAEIKAGNGSDTDPLPLPVSDDNYSWFSFKAMKDAEYSFTVTGDGYRRLELYSASDIENAVASDSVYWGELLSLSHTMAKDDMVYIKLSTDGQGGLQISVKEENAVDEITGVVGETGDVSATVTVPGSSKSKYSSYTVSEDGIYRFATEGAAGVRAVLRKNSLTEGEPADTDASSNGDVYVDCYMKAGEKAYIGLSSYDTGAEQTDIKLNVTKKEIHQVSAQEGSEDIFANMDVAAAASEWFAFDVEADSDYTFIIETNRNVCGYMYTVLGEAAAVNTNAFNSVKYQGYASASAGKVYWKIKNISRSQTASIKISIKKNAVGNITTDAENGTQAQVYPETSSWFSFTAPESAEYEFMFKSDSYYNADAALYESLGADDETYLVRGSFSDSSSYFYDSLDDGTGVRNPKIGLVAGKTVYWKVTNNNSTALNVTIKAKKAADVIVTLDSENGAAADIYGGSEQWYSFTATEEARYIFTFTRDNGGSLYIDRYEQKDGERLDRKYLYDYSNNTFTNTYYLARGSKMFWKVDNRSNTEVNFSIKAEKVEVTPLTEENRTDIEFAPDAEKWFSFTADSDAEYEFVFRSDSTSNAHAYLYDSLGADNYLDSGYFNNSNSYFSSNNISNDMNIKTGNVLRLTLAANDCIYWKVKNDTADTIKTDVNIRNTADEVLTAGADNATSFKLFKGSQPWFCFTADEDMRYTFTFTGDNSSSLYAYLYEDKEESSKSNVYFYNNKDGSYEYYMDAGSTVYWLIQNTGYSASDANITIKTQKADIEDMNAMEPDAAVAMDSGDIRLFKYTAAKDGRYEFAFTLSRRTNNIELYRNLKLDETELYIYNYDSETDAEGNTLYIGKAECYISSGETVYWKVPNTRYDSAEVFVSAKAQQFEINDWTQETVSIEPGAEKWFSYTAPGDAEAAPYELRFDITLESGSYIGYCDIDLYKTLKISRNDAKSVGTSSGGSNTYCAVETCYINPGEAVYFRIKNRNDAAISLSMTAEQKVVKELTIAGDAAGNTYELSGKSVQWFKFESAEDARYAFTFTKAGSSYNYSEISLYEALDAETEFSFEYASGSRGYVTMISVSGDDAHYEGTESCYIPAGSAVYWKVENTSGNVSTVITGTANVEKVNVIDLKQNTSIAENGIEIPQGQEKWFGYTADEDARYNFAIELASGYGGNEYVYLYNDINQTSNTKYLSISSSGYNSQASCEAYIPAGNTVYWRIKSTGSAARIFKLNVEKIGFEEIKLDDADGISLALNKSSRWVKFDVPETGAYSFTVEEVSGSAYMKRYKTLDADDFDRAIGIGSGSGYTNKMTYSFEAGMTVYLKIENDSATDFTGTLKFQKDMGVTGMSVGDGAAVEISVDEDALRYKWLEFTAPSKGDYKFYTENSSIKAWFVKSMDVYYDNGSYSNNTSILNKASDNTYSGGSYSSVNKTILMEKGETVYIAVGDYNLSSSASTTLYVEKSVNTQSLSLNSYKYISAEADTYKLLEFTAPAAGSYEFYTSSIGDESAEPYIWIFEDNEIGNYADAAELDAGCMNKGNLPSDKKLVIELYENQTVYIAAGAAGLGGATVYYLRTGSVQQ